ncbi:hypothetical protein ACMGG9_07885 [Serratia sp. BNK-10]|uniref:hypothetical protein n=1 Tax=Serratia sp. BNK-10 TaxID=3376147 RepID=UPI0039BFB136
MTPEEYKKIYSSTISNFNTIIDKRIKNNKNFNFDMELLKPRIIEIAFRAKRIMSGISKHDPISFPNDYSRVESERYIRIITRLYETTDMIVNDVSTVVEIDLLETSIDKLIPIYRIAHSFIVTSSIDEKIASFNKDMDERTVIINDLIKNSEIQLKNVGILTKDAKGVSNEALRLVDSLRKDIESANEKFAHIDNILMKSEAAYASIDSVKSTLNTASLSLKSLQDKNEIITKDLSSFILSSENKVNSLLAKEKRISSIERDLTSGITQSQELIENAKIAMTLTGTFRLSRSFKSAYLIAKKTRDRWALASSISAILSLAFVGAMLYEMYTFDYKIFQNSTTPAIMMFIARLSILPVVLGFFAFCAMQYIKQNNICEDYAHKKLLSETLISFKDELSNSDNEKTTSYLSEILKVVLRSPINLVDKKTHQAEIGHINSIVTQTNEIGRAILDKFTSNKPPQPNDK